MSTAEHRERISRVLLRGVIQLAMLRAATFRRVHRRRATTTPEGREMAAQLIAGRRLAERLDAQ